MREEFKTALANCSLQNGVLSIPSITDTETIKLVCSELRNTIIDSKLPHYKVIGMRIVSGSQHLLTDYITKTRDVSKSYAELLTATDKMIFAEARGTCPGLAGDIPSSVIDELGFVMGVESHITTSNGSLFYMGEGVASVAKSLVQDLDVVDIHGNANIQFILRKGTGTFWFPDAGQFLRRTQFVPVGQNYDLSTVLSVKLYEKGDTKIYFRYKENVDESVLEKILRNYGNE